MSPSHRPPRAIAITQPIARARMTRDLAADWRRWSRLERATATLALLLATVAAFAWVLLGHG